MRAFSQVVWLPVEVPGQLEHQRSWVKQSGYLIVCSEVWGSGGSLGGLNLQGDREITHVVVSNDLWIQAQVRITSKGLPWIRPWHMYVRGLRINGLERRTKEL